MTHALCAECGEPLPPTKRPWNPARYCSDVCRHRYNRRVKKTLAPRAFRKTCLHCGRRLPERSASIGGGPQLFCGRNCCAKHGYQRRKPPLPKACGHCGAPMEALRRTQKWCSDVCRNRAGRARRKLPPPPSPREALVMMVGWPGVKRAA
jgi:hypothetical protein